MKKIKRKKDGVVMKWKKNSEKYGYIAMSDCCDDFFDLYCSVHLSGKEIVGKYDEFGRWLVGQLGIKPRHTVGIKYFVKNFERWRNEKNQT